MDPIAPAPPDATTNYKASPPADGGRRASSVYLDMTAMPKRPTRLALFVVTVLAILLARPAGHHARAASLLLSFADTRSPADARGVTDERITFPSRTGRVAARLYAPAGRRTTYPGVVLVHGVHHAGVDEPRLERFARAVAASGIVVMTPAVAELSDYTVAPRSIDTVGDAIDDLRARLGAERVGLMGMSFGGGVSLLAAADARFAEHVSFVVAVGAHHDLGRVSRFFLDDAIAEPDGSVTPLRAHGYGVMVLVHAHADAFFPSEEAPIAREALRRWLREERDEARSVAAKLSPSSRGKLTKLFDDGAAEMRDDIVRYLAQHEAEMAAVSPRGQLGAIRANVYLLHGAGDTVIPASETRWLAAEVPPSRLRTALVSPAIEHVELKSPSAKDQVELVHFMAQVLADAER